MDHSTNNTTTSALTEGGSPEETLCSVHFLCPRGHATRYEYRVVTDLPHAWSCRVCGLQVPRLHEPTPEWAQHREQSPRRVVRAQPQARRGQDRGVSIRSTSARLDEVLRARRNLPNPRPLTPVPTS